MSDAVLTIEGLDTVLGEVNGVTVEGQRTPQGLTHRTVVIDHKNSHVASVN